jgi:hypothetical protein
MDDTNLNDTGMILASKTPICPFAQSTTMWLLIDILFANFPPLKHILYPGFHAFMLSYSIYKMYMVKNKRIKLMVESIFLNEIIPLIQQKSNL